MLALTARFAVVEVVGGLVAGSLALLADAAHMLSDAASLALALGAIWLARPARPRRGMSFGYRRAEILAALANGVALVAVAIWIIVEAVGRLSVTDRDRRRRDPGHRAGRPGRQRRRARRSCGARAARASTCARPLLHVFADLLGSAGVVVAAILVLTLGWLRADPVIAIAIGVLVLVSSWRVLRESVARAAGGHPGGHRRATRWAGGWPRCPACARSTTCTSGPSPRASPPCRPTCWWAPTRTATPAAGSWREMLDEEFGIHHTTLQVEHSEEEGRLHRVSGLDLSPPADPSGT